MIPLGLLHMRPLQYWFEANVPSHAWRLGSFHLRVTHHCIKTPWKSSHLFQSGIPLGLTSRRKVVTTDASNSGWGAPYKGRPAFGSWARQGQTWNDACTSTSSRLESFLALKTFLLALKGHHVLVRSDNMTVEAFINHQGGLRSHSLYRFTQHILLWAQGKLSH